jgi:hypothetical protein
MKHQYHTQSFSLFCTLIFGALLSSSVPAAETLFQEGFNTDGNGTRYTVEGGGVYEHSAVTWRTDQDGPLYWARSSDVSIVGVPGPTPARRALLTYHHTIDPSLLTDNFWTIFDATVNWLTKGKTSGNVIFSADPSANPGDQALADRLTSKGWTVTFDTGGTDPLPAASAVDLVIKTSSGDGGNPGRFSLFPVPMLAYNAADLDDELIGSIGQSAINFQMSDLTIKTNHPAAGGLTGTVPIITGPASFDMIGDTIPEGAIVIATYDRDIPFVLDTLEKADTFIAGTAQSNKAANKISSLDVSESSSGAFTDDNALPDTVGDSYVLQAKGKIQVDTAGTYRFGLGVDDGGRLRIDKDKNGFTDADNVVVINSTGALRFSMANVTFAAAGAYDFEVVAFDQGGASGMEVAVSSDTSAPDPLTDSSSWELISATSTIKLTGDVDVNYFTPDVPAAKETRPFLVLLNGPDEGGVRLSGGPFTGYEGTAFFAGAALNKGDTDNFVMPDAGYRSVRFPAVNVAGKKNLQLTMAAAATFLDFETSDYLDVWIDPNNTGNFQQLIHFTAPNDPSKFFDDRSTHPANPTKLGLRFQDVTYDVPAGATDLVIEVRGLTTWWNEIVGFDNLRLTQATGGPVTPTIAISKSGGTASITFTGTLQKANKLPAATTDWTDVQGSSPYTVPTTGTAGFFRAKQ